MNTSAGEDISLFPLSMGATGFVTSAKFPGSRFWHGDARMRSVHSETPRPVYPLCPVPNPLRE